MRLFICAALAFSATVAAAAPVSGQGTWETTLQARDINGDGIVDAYYSSTQNITWLADANYAATMGASGSNPPIKPGLMDKSAAETWLAGLDVYGVTGWRLPNASNYAPAGCGGSHGISAGMFCSFVAPDGSSEISDLYHLVLGNTTGGWTNTGGFTNLRDAYPYFWIGTTYTGPSLAPWVTSATMNFDADYGDTIVAVESYRDYVWAVHDGDIAPVPEPETYALTLGGLGVLALLLKGGRRRGDPHGV